MRDDVVMDARTLHVGGEWYSIEWYAYLWDLRAVEKAALAACTKTLCGFKKCRECCLLRG